MAVVRDLKNVMEGHKSLIALRDKLIQFRDERDWKQFHNPKDVAISLALEANEVLEHFQWKSQAEIEAYVKTNRDDIAEEMADVLNWLVLLSDDLGVDLVDAAFKKIEKNAVKYPVDKARGQHTKYTKL